MRRILVVAVCVALFIAGQSPTAGADDLWVAPTHGEPVQLQVTWPMTQYALGRFVFGVPANMSAFQGARLVFLPTASASGALNVYLQVKRAGEFVAPGDTISHTTTAALTASQLTEIDISAALAGVIDASSAGQDQVSLIAYAPAPLLSAAHLVGLRFTYAAAPVGSTQLADGAVTSAKILDGQVTGQDVANNALTGAHIQNRTLTAADLESRTITSFELADDSVGPAALAGNAVLGSHILDNTIETFDVKNDSLLAADLKDEPGVEFAGDDQNVPALAVVRFVDLTAPANGYVTVMASGTFFFSGSGLAECNITNLTGFDNNAMIRALGNDQHMPFAGTRTFSVSGGTTTRFSLYCVRDGQVSAQDTQMSAIYLPTRY